MSSTNFKSIFDREFFDFYKSIGENVGFYLDMEKTEVFRENQEDTISLTELSNNSSRPLQFDNFFNNRVIFRGIEKEYVIPGTVLGLVPGVVRLKREVDKLNMVENNFDKCKDNCLWKLVNRTDGFILDSLTPIPFPMNKYFVVEEDDIDQVYATQNTISAKRAILRKNSTQEDNR